MTKSDRARRWRAVGAAWERAQPGADGVYWARHNDVWLGGLCASIRYAFEGNDADRESRLLAGLFADAPRPYYWSCNYEGAMCRALAAHLIAAMIEAGDAA